MHDKVFHFGLVGWPLSHSLSPVILAAALEDAGLCGDYRLFSVQPIPDGNDEMAVLLNSMRAGNLDGLNVTIPHKLAIMPYLDELTGSARSIGAVNMVFRHGKRLIGDNSDAPAFREDLHIFLALAGDLQFLVPPMKIKKDAPNLSVEPSTALVLGAGGAARAVVYSLLQEGWRLVIAARRIEAAGKMVNDFEPMVLGDAHQILAITLERQAVSKLRHCHLIVNTTPVGMSPQENSSPWPSDLPFPSEAVVYDLVYNPPETALVRAARSAGLAATSGLGMLVEQAALAFERWTGMPASRLAMSTAARKSLEKS